jgi:hypothetical protein
MNRNLGASRAAIAADDYEAYGGLYQWGRRNDGHASIDWSSRDYGTPIEDSTSKISITDTPEHGLFIQGTNWRSTRNNNLWQGENGTNNPCPAGYRVPSNSEFEAEIIAYHITDAVTAYNSVHKFVMAGNRYYSDASLYDQGVSINL